MIPYGLFVNVPEEAQRKFNLPPGMPSSRLTPENGTFDAYGLTFTHEYHCLVCLTRIILC
jgi:hypothetical protein